PTSGGRDAGEPSPPAPLPEGEGRRFWGDAVRVLIAPQEFKGSLSADEAAAAIRAGIRKARPGWQLDVLPMSDGGPGFIDALRRAVKADTAAAIVQDALGRRVLARYITLHGTRTTVIEAALANGLMHIAPEERDALHADSFGVGQVIADALLAEPERLIIGVGGSATTDGGAGMARALGARFFDEAGRDLPPGGAALQRLARIDWSPPAALAGVEVVVASDVTNPLVGPEGAATVYGPQKGATPEQVEVLEAALLRYAAVVRRSLGVEIANLPGGGAAGGLAAGLVAFLGARIVSGFDVVAEAAGLAERFAVADIVITGEGSYDAQSTQGKTTGRIRALASAAGKECVLFAGRSSDEEVISLSRLEPDAAQSMARAAKLLEAVARQWAESQPS
ncbi:MAG: glycerate kinase, partial [Dehalococcoidia bacterium]